MVCTIVYDTTWPSFSDDIVLILFEISLHSNLKVIACFINAFLFLVGKLYLAHNVQILYFYENIEPSSTQVTLS